MMGLDTKATWTIRDMSKIITSIDTRVIHDPRKELQGIQGPVSTSYMTEGTQGLLQNEILVDCKSSCKTPPYSVDVHFSAMSGFEASCSFMFFLNLS